MAERPILFSDPMVRALLTGTKTQTRRAVALPRKRQGFVMLNTGAGWWPYQSDDGESELCNDGMEHPYSCPYGQHGDRLWVRETWQAFFDDEVPPDRPRGPRHTLGVPAQPERKSSAFYRADGDMPPHPEYGAALWIPSIHMPRKYSRILLEVTAVRVERLQDISRGDAMAEGIQPLIGSDGPNYWTVCVNDVNISAPTAQDCFGLLWAHINGADSWAANPWVWVVEFKRVQP